MGQRGGDGAKVREPADLPTALRTALAHPGPALLDVDVDPNEPPLPGKVNYEQAKGFRAIVDIGSLRSHSPDMSPCRGRKGTLGEWQVRECGLRWVVGATR